MDYKRLLATVDAVLAEDKAERSEAFKKRKSYWTSIRMILQKTIPILAGKIPPHASEDALAQLGHDDQIADILSWTTLQICRQDEAQKIIWEPITSLKEGQLAHFTFGAKPIKIVPYDAKPNQVVDITAIMVIHVTDRFSEKRYAQSKSHIWANIYLGGNEEFFFRLSDMAEKSVRDMAARRLIDFAKTGRAIRRILDFAKTQEAK